MNEDAKRQRREERKFKAQVRETVMGEDIGYRRNLTLDAVQRLATSLGVSDEAAARMLTSKRP